MPGDQFIPDDLKCHRDDLSRQRIAIASSRRLMFSSITKIP